jgi:hypothetical protein
VIKSRKIRWAGHVARIEKRRGADRVLVGGPRERDDFQYLGIDGRIILKCIFKKWDGEVWNGLVLVSVRAGGRLL